MTVYNFWYMYYLIIAVDILRYHSTTILKLESSFSNSWIKISLAKSNIWSYLKESGFSTWLSSLVSTVSQSTFHNRVQGLFWQEITSKLFYLIPALFFGTFKVLLVVLFLLGFFLHLFEGLKNFSVANLCVKWLWSLWGRSFWCPFSC